MNTFLVILVVVLALAVGACVGVLYIEHHLSEKFAKYEKIIAEHDKKKALLSSAVKDELIAVRNSLLRTTAAYEGVVKVVERDLDIEEDLHIVPVLPGNTVLSYDGRSDSNLLPIYQKQTIVDFSSKTTREPENKENIQENEDVSEKEVANS